MQHNSNGVESINKLIHKEKNQKKTTDKRSIDYSTTDNSSIVQGSTPVKSLPEQLAEHQNRQKSIAQKRLGDRERSLQRERNIAIDEHLHGWVMEGLVNPDYVGWVARCCHTLGLETANRLAINARNGKYPQRLFSSLLKGHMNLKAKQDYYSMPAINPSAADSMATEAGNWHSYDFVIKQTQANSLPLTD